MVSTEEKGGVPGLGASGAEDSSLRRRRIVSATPAKLWIATGVGLLTAAIAIRLAWEYAGASSIESLVTISLSIACVLGIGGLLVLFIFRPQKVATRPFRDTVAAVVAIGLVGGLLHYLRFIFLSHAPPLAMVIATALALASCCGFASLLCLLRWLRQREGAERL